MFDRKNRWGNLAFLIITLMLMIESAFACTGISIHYKNNYFLGKNHDWINKEAAIVINPRGMANHDPLYKGHNKLLKWKSKYGGITVNLVEGNKVLPGAMVGMNEKGLGVLALWQINAKYPTKPTKPVVSTDLLAKYFLDNAATITQVIQLAEQIDVEPSTLSNMDAAKVAKTLGIDKKYISNIDLHLFLQDEKGRAAVIEYINGKLVIDSGKSLPILAISNSAYSDSINYIKQFKAFGGDKTLPGEFDSLSRFTKAAYMLKVMPNITSRQQAVSYLFNALSYAQSHAPDTQWTALFDLSDKILYLRSIDNQKIRIVRLRQFNLSQGEPTRFLSINNNLSGHVESEFKTLHQPNDISQVAANFNKIEQRANGELGVFAINTADQQIMAYNADARFPMCSTAKIMAVSAILHRSMSNPKFLNEKTYYAKADIIPAGYTPITQQHIKDGMTIAELSQAAITHSDNGAMNLLMKRLGGPKQITAFARSIGDQDFMLTQWEPKLNLAKLNDKKNTTTPRSMAMSLEKLAVGHVLDSSQRDLLQTWLKQNTTGNERIRSGVPKNWTVGDKTGTCEDGTMNDIAVIWPPSDKPMIVAIYFVPNKESAKPKDYVFRSATKALVKYFISTNRGIL